jgi:hypothetical protein
VIYEKVSFKARPQNLPLYSWDPDWDYRYTDVFPALSKDGKLVFTEKSQNSSIAISDPDGSNRKRIFETAGSSLSAPMVARTRRSVPAGVVTGRPTMQAIVAAKRFPRRAQREL